LLLFVDGISGKELRILLSFKSWYLPKMKSLRVSPLIYEMLVDLSKRSKPSMKPEAFLENVIQDLYQKKK
tara:strand:- start:388 stop:597 length:210 start_codon:yes stop_codon:yes gene_type:complete